MATYTLVCPFLDESPAYAHGVEFGLFYADLRAGPDHVRGYFTRANQDQILLAASRMGYEVVNMRPWPEGDWFFLKLRRRADPCS